MEKAERIPKRIAVAWHPDLEEAKILSTDIVRELKNRSLERVDSCSLNDPVFRHDLRDGRYDLIIALGGDGTMLRAGKLGAPVQVPVMGINLGHFGFLIETQKNEWASRLDDLLAGRWETDKRMMIHISHYRGEEKLKSWDILNDLVLTRAKSIRPVHLSVHINEIELAEYVADGLILATATGSTAYSLSAGGPIVDPQLEGIILTPVSGYRTYDRQKINFENRIAVYQNQGYSKAKATDLAAQVILPPGTSEHNAGLAMDIVSLETSFENTAAFRWLCENAADYGFIMRYPKDKTDITKITYEPWHWRFVGIEMAKDIKSSGKTLEEYLGAYESF